MNSWTGTLKLSIYSMIKVLGYPVLTSQKGLKVRTHKKVVINTISPNSYGLAQSDFKVEEALKNSDALILDGVYFGWAAILLHGVRIKRITGWDAFQHFSKWANLNKGKVFFLGSSEDTLMKIKGKYQDEFPNVLIETFSPPFRDEFSNDENLEMHNAINLFSPDILFIGMTAPKQEKWAYFNKKFLNVKVICTIGNVFDWYAGNSKRPSIFWQKIGLEWLVRIFLRPEIFKRNIKNQMTFFYHLILIVLKIKKV